jgi:hypothetical protein
MLPRARMARHPIAGPSTLRAQLRILRFYKTYFPDSYGGIEQFIYQMARGCARRGIDVDVLSLSTEVGSGRAFLSFHVKLLMIFANRFTRFFVP